MKVDLDVLIFGDHPAAWLAALLLAKPTKKKHKLRRVAVVPGEADPAWPHAVLVNPAAGELHPDADVNRLDDARAITGVRFHGDGGQVAAWRDEVMQSRAVNRTSVTAKLREAAKAAGVEAVKVGVTEVDAAGLTLTDGRRATLALAAALPDEVSMRLLNLAPPTPTHVVRSVKVEAAGDPLMDVALDLGGSGVMAAGRLLRPLDGPAVASVLVPRAHADAADPLLTDWLVRLKLAKPRTKPTQVDLAPGGALAHDPVRNRTLQLGPLGGFIAVTGEELYPTLWSATHAVDAARAALDADHAQDALQSFRSSWGSTLGEYLRGPQQNLEFLLPLVFTKPNMARRLGEAMLRGESLVR